MKLSSDVSERQDPRLSRSEVRLIATRTSTRTGAACGELTRKRSRAPSATPAGTDTRTG